MARNEASGDGKVDMKRSKTKKPYWEMNLQELQEATKEFDKPIPMSRMRPLSKAEREDFERSRARGVRSIFVKRSRPKSVTLKLDEVIVTKSTEYASRHNMTLAEVIERSLRSILSFVDDGSIKAKSRKSA
jgi:hypothetical protein